MMTTLLLVEDDAMIRDMLSRRLQREGYQVIAAVNGAEAIMRARSEQPDLILMDMGLPLLNGYQATAKLKTTPETRTIPIIALTAFAMTSDRAKCLAAGCNEYESKPIVFDRLLSKIQAFLDQPDGGQRMLG
jgi:two-component system, cell cycle response regulator DivK